MNNIKSDEYYIMKILENIDNIQKIMENKTKEDLEEELITNNTIVFQFINMGENISNISNEYKESKPNVPWQMIKGMRKIIVHNYENVSYDTLYETITKDLPYLKEGLSK